MTKTPISLTDFHDVFTKSIQLLLSYEKIPFIDKIKLVRESAKIWTFHQENHLKWYYTGYVEALIDQARQPVTEIRPTTPQHHA